MPEFEVATYLECPKPELANKRNLFASILEDLGTSPTLTAEWLTSIAWNSDGSGFAQLGEPLHLERMRLNGDVVTARPYMLGYTDVAFPGMIVPWVQLSLVFEGEWEIAHVEGCKERWRYATGIGRLVWGVIQVYTRWSPDSAVFFSDSPSVNEPWKALLGRGGNAWGFDVASLPESLAHIYRPVREGYTWMAGQHRIGLARKACWHVPPWDE